MHTLAYSIITVFVFSLKVPVSYMSSKPCNDTSSCGLSCNRCSCCLEVIFAMLPASLVGYCQLPMKDFKALSWSTTSSVLQNTFQCCKCVWALLKALLRQAWHVQSQNQNLRSQPIITGWQDSGHPACSHERAEIGFLRLWG